MLRKNLRLLMLILCATSLSACSSLLVDLGLEDASDEREIASSENTEACRGSDCRQERENYDRVSKNRRITLAIQNNDIVVGMSRSDVVESWGEPSVRELAGSGNNGHERWTYGSRFSLEGERYLIFEGGQVVGWHR